ncbi:MAG: hypothetical protein K2I95_10845 [Treponemataceae bacterium]|nr:hypothetical protein [Treponemataceae bacterium]
MKKKLGALFVALALGGTVFAENYTKGIDLQFGIPIGVTKMTNDYNGVEFTQNILEFGGQFKVATYDCFLLNDMLGIYASVGVNLGGFYAHDKLSVGDYDVDLNAGGLDELGFATSLEFMIGPAFGVNLGGVRFQTGLGFHGVVARDSYYSYKYKYLYVEYTTFGFALTPQFRFSASKRCSFILGCDLTFDFPNKLTLIPEKGDEVEIEFDKGFRFGATPYIGLGINF